MVKTQKRGENELKSCWLGLCLKAANKTSNETNEKHKLESSALIHFYLFMTFGSFWPWSDLFCEHITHSLHLSPLFLSAQK
jgi:hypothetical protein